MIEFEAGLAMVLTKTIKPKIESLSLSDALGRISASQQVATIDVPSFDNSAMDGYAVRFDEVTSQRAFNVSQRIAAGDKPLALKT